MDDVVTRLRTAGCVFAEDEAALLLDAASGSELERLVAARVDGTPLEHLLGWAEFAGLRVRVAPGVFVPRRRSELLVALARSLPRAPAVVVELCAGSGAIGAALLAALSACSPDPPGIELHAADVSPAAVACARTNVPVVHLGDLFDALPGSLRGRVDLLVASPPYVPRDAIPTMPPEARDHEPHAALDGGDDGLDLARRIAASARDWLAPGGTLLLECSEAQGPLLCDAVAAAGLAASVEHRDETDSTAVLGARPLPSRT